MTMNKTMEVLNTKDIKEYPKTSVALLSIGTFILVFNVVEQIVSKFI